MAETSESGFVVAADGWAQVCPLGEFVHAWAGVTQVIDAEACAAMAADFETRAAEANFPGTLVDFDHFSMDADKPSEAAGWIMALEARDDGLWAKVRWTDAGLAAATGGRYRLMSPVFPKAAECEDLGDGKVRPRKPVSVALTNEPNIKGGKPIANRSPFGETVGSRQWAVSSAVQRKREEAMRRKLDNRWSNAARAASLAVRQAKAAARKKAATGTQAAQNIGPPQIWPHGWWRRERKAGQGSNQE